MIQRIHDLSAYTDFLKPFFDEPRYAALTAEKRAEKWEKLQKSAGEDGNLTLVSLDGDKPVGLFVFSNIEEEKYMELLFCFSHAKEAYDEIFSYLGEHRGGYTVDFVFDPENTMLKSRLQALGAHFWTEQQIMTYTHACPPVDVSDIVPLTPERRADYCAMHLTDTYWTGEKVADAPDRFKVFLALDGDKVVGYIDVTYTHEENEPFDLFVLPDFRRQGRGRKLLYKALVENKPKGMLLFVDVDNLPAIKLYESSGFVKQEHQNLQSVRWQVQ